MSCKPYMNIGPGDILTRYMETRRWSNMDLSKEIGMPLEETKRLIGNRMQVTREIAMRLSLAFGNSSDFWLNLQTNYNDLRKN